MASSFSFSSLPHFCSSSSTQGVPEDMSSFISQLEQNDFNNDQVPTYLDLSNRFLDPQLKVPLAQALSLNTSLTSLNLASKLFFRDGAQALGAALKVNKSLTALNFTNNRIQ